MNSDVWTGRTAEFCSWIDTQYSGKLDDMQKARMLYAWVAGADAERDLLFTQLAAIDIDSYSSPRELFATIQRRLGMCLVKANREKTQNA